MGGGLMQLVAYGAQDIYLTGNPQITFFKVVYRRHTNFSMEAIEQTLNGTANYGNSVTSTISRNGDLIHRMYIEHLPEVASSGDASISYCANYGSTLIKSAELEIGGQKIDKHFGHWMEVWTELTRSNQTGAVATQIVTSAQGKRTGGTLHQAVTAMGGVNGSGDTDAAAEGAGLMHIPLYFWFCRNPGLALPLIALQYHEVKLKLELEAATELHAAAQLIGSSLNVFKLFVDYIYLDTDERRRFAQVSHEYLIEQVQHQQSTAAQSIELNFNHPVKELIFSGVGATASNTVTSLSTPTALMAATATTTALLKLNGHDRFSARDLRYFTRNQVLDYHSGFGGVSLGAAGTVADTIGVYSFALKPEEHQPSGTCNFSRIDNAQLVFSAATAVNLNIYAVNYNVLRIMSGMGGLAYSN
jgi:hypothetical protein